LINGELDDNVDPASTLQVVKALMDAGKILNNSIYRGKTICFIHRLFCIAFMIF